jgi:hypothetical protein
MRSAPYGLIRMAIKMASEAAAFFSVVDRSFTNIHGNDNQSKMK